MYWKVHPLCTTHADDALLKPAYQIYSYFAYINLHSCSSFCSLFAFSRKWFSARALVFRQNLALHSYWGLAHASQDMKLLSLRSRMESIILVLRCTSKCLRWQEFDRLHAAPTVSQKRLVPRRNTRKQHFLAQTEKTHVKGKLSTDTGCVSVMKLGICVPLEWPCGATAAFLPSSSMVPLCSRVQLAVQESKTVPVAPTLNHILPTKGSILHKWRTKK